MWGAVVCGVLIHAVDALECGLASFENGDEHVDRLLACGLAFVCRCGRCCRGGKHWHGGKRATDQGRTVGKAHMQGIHGVWQLGAKAAMADTIGSLQERVRRAGGEAQAHGAALMQEFDINFKRTRGLLEVDNPATDVLLHGVVPDGADERCLGLTVQASRVRRSSCASLISGRS